jgi:hypothetical protein
LEVCKYYGDKVLRGNDNVRVISISYGKHGHVLIVFNVGASGLRRKFKRMRFTKLVKGISSESG